MFRIFEGPVIFLAASAMACVLDLGQDLFQAKPFTPENGFTAGIEGPNCDRDGNVYAVNFKDQQTIGRVTPGGRAEVWLKLPGKSTGNGIVFDPAGSMYIADYVEHNVLKVDPRTKRIKVY